MNWACHTYMWLVAGLEFSKPLLFARLWKLNLAHVAQNTSEWDIPFSCPSVKKASKCIFFAKHSEITAALLSEQYLLTQHTHFISLLVSKRTKGDAWCFSHILLLVPEKESIWSLEVSSLTSSYPQLEDHMFLMYIHSSCFSHHHFFLYHCCTLGRNNVK